MTPRSAAAPLAVCLLLAANVPAGSFWGLHRARPKAAPAPTDASGDREDEADDKEADDKSTAPAAAPARAKAAALLQGDLGEDAVEALERRGLIVQSGSGGARRLEAVAWEPLGRHLAAAPRLVALLAAYDAARRGDDSPGSFADLAALPDGGLLRAPVRAAAAALAARARARAGLGGAFAALAQQGSLWRTAWGRALAARTHADVADPVQGTQAFFIDDLASPSGPAPATAHLLAWADARGVEGVEALLASDRRAGVLSARLAAQLTRYLSDQNLLEAVTAANERLSRLERDRDAKRLFDDLRAAAPRLAAASDLERRLKELLAEKEAPADVKLSAGELHARAVDGGRLESGDKAVLSSAYWLDGLAPGRTAEVSEVLYRDDGAGGLTVVARAAHRRAAGGPYDVTIEVEVPAAGRPAYHLVLDAFETAPLELLADVPVSDRLDIQRAAAVKAEALARACRLAESTAAWNALISELGSDKKPARARLAAEAKARLKSAEGWASVKEELDRSLDGARLYASKERCDYRTDRAQRALSLLGSLPAGCDRTGSAAPADELAALMSATDSRHRLQEAFHDAVSRARDRESACKSGEAAELYASALALLDSDPETRCGDFEKEYAAVRMTDLPRAAASERLGAALDGELDKARALAKRGDSAGALDILLPLSTALRRLPDARCWAGPLAKADALVEGAGIALAPAEDLARGLPRDSTEGAVAEARRDWDRRQAERDKARDATESFQAPNAAGGTQ